MKAVFLALGISAILTVIADANERETAPVVAVAGTYQYDSDIAQYVGNEEFSLSAYAFGDFTALWHMPTGVLARKIPMETRAIAQFKKSNKVVLANDDEIAVWDLSSGARLVDMEKSSFNSSTVAVSPDGKLVYGGGSSGVKVWNAASGRLVKSIIEDSLTDFIRLSTDGNRLFAADVYGAFQIRSTKNGKLLFAGSSSEINSDGGSIHAESCPDLSRAAFWHYEAKFVEVWDLQKRSISLKLDTKSRAPHKVAFSDDCTLVAIQTVGAYGALEIYNLRNGDRVTELDVQADSLDFSADGKRLLVTKDGTTAEYEIQTGTQTYQVGAASGAHVGRVALSADAALLTISLAWRTSLWDIAVGLVAELPVLSNTHSSESLIASIDFTPDRKAVIIGDWNGFLHTVDLASRDVRARLDLHNGKRVNSLVLSGDGRTGLSSGDDGTVAFFDVETSEVLRRFEPFSPSFRVPIPAIALSKDGMRAAAVVNNQVVVWNAETGDEIARTSPNAETTSVFFEDESGSSIITIGSQSPGRTARISRVSLGTGQITQIYSGSEHDGRSIAAYDPASGIVYFSVDNAVYGVNTSTGAVVHEATVYQGRIDGVTLSADGSRLVTMSATDGSVVVWDTLNDEQLVRLHLFPNERGSIVDWVMITPEGFFTGTPGGMAKVAVVRGMEVFSIDQAYDALFRPDLVQAKLAGDPDGLVAAAASQLNLQKVLDTGLAPNISIAAPAAVSDSEVVVEATLSDRGGGVGNVVWSVNGVTIGVDTPTFRRNEKTVVLRRTIRLSAGDNTISAVAHNADNLLASAPATAIVDSGVLPTGSKGRLFVLAVGINDYWDSRLRLTYAVPDARAIAASFGKAGEELFDAIHVRTIEDAEATIAKLEAAFLEIAAEAVPDDAFIFFVAGHGVTLDGKYHFLPYEFRHAGNDMLRSGAIDQQRWQGWFAKIAAKRSVLLFDTCESGSLTQQGPAMRGVQSLVAVEKLTKATGRTILAASTEAAPALEGVKGHGVFSYVLLNALAEADANRDALVQITELAGYVDRRVPEISFENFGIRQIPQMSLVGSDFAIGKSGASTVEFNATVVDPSDVSSGTAMVAIVAAPIFDAAAVGATEVGRVTPGMQLRALHTEGGRTLVARDGKKLGFVEEKALVPLQ